MRTPRGSSRGWRRRRTAQKPRRGAGDRRRGIPGGGTGTRHRPATAARCRAAAAARYRPVARSRSRSRPDLPRAPIRRVVSLAQPQMRTLVSRVPMSSENLAGRTVAGYRLLERVGEGGTAEVYRAEHPERGPCAFKVLRQRLRGDPTAVKRFLREAGYGTRVRHPGVVRTLEYVAPEALSGELVDGRADIFSLATITYWLLAGVHPFSGRTPRELFQQLLSGAPVPLNQAVRGVQFPAALEAAVMRGLA